LAEGAAAEVAPQVEMRELHFRGIREVAGEKAEERLRMRLERVEQRRDAGEHALAGTGPRHFLAKALEVAGTERCKRVGDAEDVVKGQVHRPLPGASGDDERAVDVKQDELVHKDEGRRTIDEGR